MSPSRALFAVLLLAGGLCSTLAAQPGIGEPQTEKRQAIQIDDQQIPYALRAAMFLKLLADMQEEPLKDGISSGERLLDTLGLEIDSPTSRGLIETAVAFKAARPPLDPHYIMKLEESASIAAQRARQLELHRLAGEAFGEWLRRLELEGPEIDALLSKLLDSPYVGMTIGTTDPELDMAYIAARARAFEQAVQEKLGYVPGFMRQAGEEGAQ